MEKTDAVSDLLFCRRQASLFGVRSPSARPLEISPQGGTVRVMISRMGRPANKKLRTIILYIPIEEDFSVFGYIGFFFLNMLFNIRIVSRLMLRKSISYFS